MPPKRKAAKGYKLAALLPEGIILVDLGKNKWRLGPSIGEGGFGAIYSAQQENSKSKLYPYVVKIEPHTNGPLFVEINFYIRHGKSEFIEEFKNEKGLKTFGMPVYHGSGSMEFKGEKYRFLVMDKFQTDLHTLFVNNSKVFPTDTVFKIGLQIVDVLEFIHQRGYVHADIKASNILLGILTEKEYKQTYLVDFGLSTKYTMDKEFKPNPKKAHDGTIEFLSRDAHQGVQTRRGDLEILAYNLIQWLGCKLPWENNLSDPKIVQKSKEENMATVPKMIKASFGSTTSPKAIVDFLKYLKTLRFDTEPDYKIIRDILTSGVKESGGSIGTILQFSTSRSQLKRNRTPLSNSKTGKSEINDDVQETPNPKKKERTKNNFKSTKNDRDGDVSDDREETPKSKKSARLKKDFVVDSENNDVEMPILDNNNKAKNTSFITVRRKLVNNRTNEAVTLKKTKSLQDLSNELDLDGYNDAMKEVKLKKLKVDTPIKRSRRVQNNKIKTNELNAIKENDGVSDVEDDTLKPKQRKLNDIESENYSDDELNYKITDKTTNRQAKLRRKISKSLDDLNKQCDFEGYNDAMKEVMLKKLKTGGRAKRVITRQKTQTTTQSNDDMAGFTEEMKAIALKKKAKENTGKNISTIVPLATTSKASDKKGLVKSNSKRIKKKIPITHGEVLGYSDDSMSD